MKKKYCYLLSICMLLSYSCSNSQHNYLNESREDKDMRMEWWREARFGMFIHWGLYSVAAGKYQGKKIDGYGEWIMDNAKIPVEEYEKYAAEFNPVKFDAAQWVGIAKNAGMKYIVITGKHHDGFCLWDTPLSKYDIMDASPYKKDILKALADECEKQNIRLCFYHSIMDWHHPDANPKNMDNTPEERKQNFPKYREKYLKPQLKELLTKYGNIGVIWFDGEWIDEWTEDQGRDLYNYLRNIQPDLIVSNRVGKERTAKDKTIKYTGDFGTPEQEILEGTSDVDWESCITMNDTWGFKNNDHNWKSARTLVHNLIDIAAKGGNFLLNIGPTADGLIPEASMERLQDIGKWLKTNGEAIYATHAIKRFKEGDSIRFTQSKDNKFIYVFSYTNPGEKLIVHSIVPKEETQITLLGYDKPLEWTYSMDTGLTIVFPEELRKQAAWAYAFKVEGIPK